MSSGAEAPPRLRGRSIAWPIFALVLASVLVATSVFFVVTFSGPPPRDPPRAIATLAEALRTGRPPSDPGPTLSVEAVDRPPGPMPFERVDPAMAARLARDLGVPPRDAIVYHGPDDRLFEDALTGRFLAGARIPGGWRIVRSAPPPFLTHWHVATLVAMLAAIAALAGPAFLIARAITRPLRRLATVARSARIGASLGQLPDARSREVRDLTEAVTAMHTRLARHAEGRTVMLGAIAHDLGTPLSRLAFWVEQLPETARARAAADIDEMRAMIAGALRFARNEGEAQADVRVDLGSLLDSLVEDMAVAGAPVTLRAGPRVVVRGDPGALRRMTANLLENGVRYGGRATLDWQVAGEMAEIAVEDEGPGVDVTQVERLFEPFVRGDPSRNRATGGTGLGLAIVRSIAIRHGGDAGLENAAGGGARAWIRLPLAR